MKKAYLFIITVLLLIPMTVFAEKPSVSTLSAGSDGLKVIYNGTISNESTAVMCKLYDSNDKEIDKLSTEVNNGVFSGEFKVNSYGVYKVSCANYEGGAIKKDVVAVSKNGKFTVRFVTSGGSVIEDLEVQANASFEKPENPTKKGYLFDGWYTDEELKSEYDFSQKVLADLTLYVNWIEDEAYDNYTVKNENGDSITFRELDDKSFTFSMIDHLNLTDEDLKKMDIPKEEYDKVKEKVLKAVEDEGKILAFYDIVVKDENGVEITEGEFNIKIKLTDDMKKYNTFTLIYIRDDYSIEEPILLKVEGDYLVGTLPHLSAYALMGNITTPPNTGDTIYIWVGALVISAAGLIYGVIRFAKTKKSK